MKRKPSWTKASRIACCAGSGCTLIGSRSPESTARAISSSVVTPMFIPRSCCPSIIVIGVSHGISSPNGTTCTAPGLHLEGTAEPQLRELDVLLVLLVAALDLDRRLQTDGQPLDLLVDGTALDPHLTLDDTARNDVDLGQHRLDRSPAGTQAREQLLERPCLSFSSDPCDPLILRNAIRPWPVPSLPSQGGRFLATPFAETHLHYARTP